MDILFKPEILGFLNLLHRSPRYLGIADLKKEYAEHLPNMRTIYRWQKELGDKFRYFPRIHFQALGLVHLHLLIEKPSDKWVLFPFAVEIAWLIKDMNERVLYLHCLVPEIYMDTFQNLLMDLKNEGFCKDLKTIQTGDGTQTLKDLKSCFDRKGRIEIDELEENDSGWDLVIGSRYGQDLLKQCPLIIPVVFENYGRKMSLPDRKSVE